MTALVHIVCPHCDAVNRLPEAKLASSGKCGKCHKALFEGRPVAVDGPRFTRQVAKNEIPVLDDFWAPWCGPCQAMAPEFEKAAARLEPGIRLLKLDTETAPDIAARLSIRSIPTLALFVGGREIARTAGAMNAAGLVSWVAEHLPDQRAAASA